jgi:hypothetical protein
MRRVRLFGFVSFLTVAVGGWVDAQEQKKSDASEKSDEGLPRKLSDEEKTFIEKEVERRVKEALEAAKTSAASPQDKDQGAKIEELDRKVNEVIEAQKKVRPGEFNPAIGLVGETIFSYRSRGSDETGSGRPGGIDIWQRSVELNIAAAVDPFFRGYAVINASADAVTGEATLGVEEASLVSTSLPLNLTLQAGRFFAEFGRLGNIHDHELPFVNRPLALAQYVGGESRTDGLQLNWLVPVDHYISVTAGLGDSFGGDAGPNFVGPKRGAAELNFWTRVSTFFELSDDWQFETGLSGMMNPRSDGRASFSPATLQPNGSTITETRRSVVDLDFRLAYVPLVNNQFTSLTWGTELLWSRDRFLMDPDGSLNTGVASGDEFTRSVGAFGAYSYITYKWDRQWSGGVLAEHFENAEDRHSVTSAYSAYITWATSHWNQIRIQFTRTEQNQHSGLKDDNAIYVQWAWIIGAHSHGWAQR